MMGKYLEVKYLNIKNLNELFTLQFYKFFKVFFIAYHVLGSVLGIWDTSAKTKISSFVEFT